MKSNHFKVILTISLRVLVVFILLEGLLRVQGFALLKIQEMRNQKNLMTQGEYRILCVGGSLTTLGGEDSYPNQLQKQLNTSFPDKNITVINRGVPGADSTMIVNEVVEKKLFEKYKPHMVIAMMGFNDRNELIALEHKNIFQKINSFLEKKVNVYRLIKRLVLNQKHSKSKPDFGINVQDEAVGEEVLLETYYPNAGKKVKIPPIKALQLFQMGKQYQSQKKYVEAEKIYKLLLTVDIPSDNKDSVLRELIKCQFQLKKYREMMPFVEYTLMTQARELQSVDMILNLCQNKSGIEESIEMLSRLVEKKSETAQFYTLLGVCSLAKGDSEGSRSYFEKSDQLRQRKFNPILKHNFVRLANLLHEQSIKSIFVAYPLRNLESFKRMFKSAEDFEKITFVDNEGSFRTAIEKNGYDAYFSDRACGDFGHGTALGYKLLASNIAKEISQYIK